MLSSGNVLAQIITIAVLPIITRLIGPEEYGIFAVFLSITMVVGRVSTLQYHQAILLPQREDLADSLFILSTAVAVIVSIAILPLLILIHNLNLSISLRDSEGLYQFYLFLPFAIFLHGVNLSANNWALRKNEFKSIAVSRVSAATFDRGVSLSLVAVGMGVSGLILGCIAGPLVGTLLIISRLVTNNQISFQEMKSDTSIKLKQVLHRYYEFPLFSTWATLLNGLSSQLPTLLLLLYFDPVTTGLYALAMRVVNMPMMLVGDAISRAFFQKACECNRTGHELASQAKKMFSALLYISCPPIIVLCCFGETLFTVIFGSEWNGVGPYIQVLGLAFVFAFVHRPIASLYDTFEKQKPKLLFNIVLLSVKFLSVSIAAFYSESVFIALTALSVTTIIVYLFSFRYIFRLLNVNWYEFAGFFMKSLFLLSVTLIGLPVITFFFNWSFPTLMLVTLGLFLLQSAFLAVGEPWVLELLPTGRRWKRDKVY